MANISTPPRDLTEAPSCSNRGATLRAVDYVRVSTEEQKNGYGKASQMRENHKYITAKGWRHVDTYSDEGISGSKKMGERGDFDRLMRDAESASFDIVVVSRGDRIGRVGRAFWRWVWALEDMGIYIAVVNRDITNATPDGRTQIRREADYAETEWENIRSRTQAGLQLKAEEDGSPHIGGRPPFGYKIVNKGITGDSRLEINEDEAAIVRHVYDMVVCEGLNLRQVTFRLNAEGNTARCGRRWTTANLRDRVMSGPVLDGVLRFRGAHAKHHQDSAPLWGESVAIKLPRILTEDEAASLRHQLATTARRGGPRRAVYPLSGRVVSACGGSYTGISMESLYAGRRYYKCNRRMDRVPGEPTCGCPSIDAPALEGHIWAEIVDLLGDSKKLEELAAEWGGMAEVNQTAHVERIAELDREIGNLHSAIATVMATTAKQGRPAEAAEWATRALNDELVQLKQQRNEAALWLAEIEDRRARGLKEIADVTRDRLPEIAPEQQTEILSILELKVTITGTMRGRRKGVPCPVGAWYRKAGLSVPADDLSDVAWSSVAPLLPVGKGKASAVRRSIDMIFCKARTGLAWSKLPDRYGSASTASKYFVQWAADGTWGRVNKALTDVPRVPVAEPDLLPPMEIEGRIDPRARDRDDQNAAHDSREEVAERHLEPAR